MVGVVALFKLEDKLLRSLQLACACARALVLHHRCLDGCVEHTRTRQDIDIAHNAVADRCLCLDHTFAAVLNGLAWHFRRNLGRTRHSDIRAVGSRSRWSNYWRRRRCDHSRGGRWCSHLLDCWRVGHRWRHIGWRHKRWWWRLNLRCLNLLDWLGRRRWRWRNDGLLNHHSL